jgi:small nuclear ribonucleoprotein (snRNP)-like protein
VTIYADECLVTGTLKGYDQLMNLVLDNVKEITRGKIYRSSIILYFS